MRKRIYHALVLITLLITAISSAHSQNLSTKGTDFWMSFLQAANATPPVKHVYISSDFATSGTISIPLSGWSQDFTVAANSTTDIVVSNALCEPDQNQIAQPKGIHVVTDSLVSVYALDYEQHTSDATVIFPTPSLGYDYWVVSNKGLNYSAWPSEFVILSVADGSVFEITSSAVTTNGNAAGVPFTITLDQGETYMVQEGYAVDINGELTGSRVRAIDSNACHRFALFAGSRCSFLPDGVCCCDMLYEQMVPTKSLGKNYYTVPLKSRLGDFIRVVASVDNTQFTINGGSPITLNAGDRYDFTETEASIITANEPVAVAQYSPSLGYDNQNGDPFMIMMTPIEQHMELITFNAFTSDVITNYYLNVVSSTTAINTIELDGSPIGAGNFSAFANDPNFSYAQLDITVGNHTLESAEGFIAYVYGFGNYESYGYGVGTNLNILPLSFNIVYNGDTVNYLEFDDTIGCPGDFTVIAVGDTTYDSYQWDFGDSTYASGITVDYVYGGNGTYTITLYGYKADQCAPDAVSATVIVGNVQNIFPTFNITYDGTTTFYSSFFDTLLCTYTVNFSAFLDSLATHYYWDFGDGTIDSGQNVTHTYHEAGVFTITLTEKGDSCYSGLVHWTIVVDGGNNLTPYYYIVYNGDTTLFSEFNTTIGCHRDFTFIGYSDPYVTSWNWNFGDGTSGSGQTVSHSYSSAGDYTVTLNTEVDPSCLDTFVSHVIHIVDSISVSIPDLPLCYNGTVLMQATTFGNPALLWSTGETSSSIVIDQPGTYYIYATLDQCLVTDTAVVTFIPKIQNFLPPLDSVCTPSGIPAVIGCESGINCFSAYLWNTGDTTETINIDTAGFYSVFVIDENGCTGSDTEQVVLYCPPFLIFPLAFSPNSDGKNDGFGPLGLHIVTVSFSIFNRWGELVFTGNKLDDRWNGTYKGKDQPVDVFVYSCSYTDDIDPSKIHWLSGNVTLVR